MLYFMYLQGLVMSWTSCLTPWSSMICSELEGSFFAIANTSHELLNKACVDNFCCHDMITPYHFYFVTWLRLIQRVIKIWMFIECFSGLMLHMIDTQQHSMLSLTVQVIKIFLASMQEMEVVACSGLWFIEIRLTSTAWVDCNAILWTAKMWAMHV